MATKKNFRQIGEGDLIYSINPIEGTIIPIIVAKSYPARHSLEYTVIKYHLVKPIPNVSVQDVYARAIESGVTVKQGTLIAPNVLSSVITNTMPPLIFATTEDELLSWKDMKRR